RPLTLIDRTRVAVGRAAGVAGRGVWELWAPSTNAKISVETMAPSTTNPATRISRRIEIPGFLVRAARVLGTLRKLEETGCAAWTTGVSRRFSCRSCWCRRAAKD